MKSQEGIKQNTNVLTRYINEGIGILTTESAFLF